MYENALAKALQAPLPGNGAKEQIFRKHEWAGLEQMCAEGLGPPDPEANAP